ncbi:MAG: hypothetical protein LBR89_03665 [Holosporales bacterium]|jgi:hypothetical protein|nr:hypothetical protein [Holosporales bacterium]
MKKNLLHALLGTCALVGGESFCAGKVDSNGVQIAKLMKTLKAHSNNPKNMKNRNQKSNNRNSNDKKDNDGKYENDVERKNIKKMQITLVRAHPAGKNATRVTSALVSPDEARLHKLLNCIFCILSSGNKKQSYTRTVTSQNYCKGRNFSLGEYRSFVFGDDIGVFKKPLPDHAVGARPASVFILLDEPPSEDELKKRKDESKDELMPCANAMRGRPEEDEPLPIPVVDTVQTCPSAAVGDCGYERKFIDPWDRR